MNNRLALILSAGVLIVLSGLVVAVSAARLPVVSPAFAQGDATEEPPQKTAEPTEPARPTEKPRATEPGDLSQDEIDAAVRELFAATATAQAAYDATLDAQLFEGIPPTLTVQAAFQDAVQATQQASIMQAIYGSLALDLPEADLFGANHRTEDGDPALGSAQATVTIVEYSDFACGYCRRFYVETLPLLMEQYGDQIRFVYRDFPILGQGSVNAAIAAECADEQDRFWDYHNTLFANQGNFDDTLLLGAAYTLGLDMDRFEACYASDDMLEEIQVDYDDARTLGATGTPSFSVNGELLVGAQPFDAFQQAIDRALDLIANPPPPTWTPSGPQPVLIPLDDLPQWSAPPEMVIDPNKTYYATFVTAKGDIVVELFADQAPITVNNFVFLAREGFYDNTSFHRVIDGFMAQGGDPSGTGRGGPGYTFEDETDNGLTFDEPGLLAMANAGSDTNGSQFFITYAPTEWLDGNHTIFGKVIEGMDIAEALTRRDPQQNPTFLGDTLIAVKITEE
ncbi:MAG: peptidylprolyl isomerase [Anaerolineae bacterium]|nr:peptidylprolyl isomerase [Anaerolineae bacterium]